MSITGTLAGAVAAPAGALVAYADPQAILVGSVAAPVGALAGSAHPSGNLDAYAPAVRGSVVGYVVASGEIDGNMPRVTGLFRGGPLVIGAVAGIVPAVVGRFNDGPIATFTGIVPAITGAASAWAGTAASGIWLYLHTKPPAQVYATDAIRGRLTPWLPMHRAQFSVSATVAQIGARNDTFSVGIEGAGLALRTRLAAQAPFGVRVDVMDGGAVSRSGIVRDFALAADGSLDIDCEADRWTADLPLRTNADLGTFRDLRTLPRRYGRAVPGLCVRLGAAGTTWLWADHSSARITSVQIDGQDYGAWQWRNDIDRDGNPITIILTADEIDEGAELVAVGDGLQDSISGALIVNPADMALDLCRIAGLPIDPTDLLPFRTECAERDLEISGTVDAGSLQSALVALAESIHAAFSRELPGLLRLLPRSGATVTIPAADTPTAKADRSDYATRLRVRYAVEDDKPRATIEVRAAGVEAIRPVVAADVLLPLIRDSRSAADVAIRMLGDRARLAYTIPAAAQRRRLVPGDVVSVAVPSIGLSGEALVQSCRIEETKTTPTLVLRVGAAPAITIASTATAYTPAQYTGASVSTVGSDRVIVITGSDGRPIVGASCTLDGSMTRTSDNAGRVAFPISAMPAGQRTILVTAAGYNPFTLTVTV